MALGALLDGIPESAAIGVTILQDGAPEDTTAFVMAFAARAILSMLASTMPPEAAREGGPVVGLVTSAGFLVAVLLDRL